MSLVDLSQLKIGDVVVETETPVSRAALSDSAAAAGDHNPIHWSERFAQEVGLEGVIAHGMLSMAVVVSPIAEWLGDPGAIVDYRTRFSAPVLVPDAESGPPSTPTTALTLTAKVGAVDPAVGTLRIDATVTAGGNDVLSRTQIRVGR